MKLPRWIIWLLNGNWNESPPVPATDVHRRNQMTQLHQDHLRELEEVEQRVRQMKIRFAVRARKYDNKPSNFRSDDSADHTDSTDA